MLRFDAARIKDSPELSKLLYSIVLTYSFRFKL